MPPSRTALAFLILLVAGASMSGVAQQAPSQPVTASKPTQAPARSLAAAKLPPLSYVCPMPQDAEIVEDKAGKCRKCGMNLVPIRLDTAWSCPTHIAIVQGAPGKCPIDKRDLVQITASVFYSCKDDPSVHHLEPGKCADSVARVQEFARRAHGDHNPRHGGQFFMADDSWHHLEGTYRGNGLFRVYFYNDFTQPIPPKGFVGRAALLDASDNEVASIPLKPTAATRTALEARVTKPQLPLKVKLWMKFGATDTKEHPFDFAFTEVSKEPPVGAPATTQAAAPAAPNPPAAATTQAQVAPPAPTPGEGGGQTPGGFQPPLPNNAPDLLAELLKRNDEVQALLGQGALGQLWFPAIMAKDMALALESYEGQLSDRQRIAASNAVRRLVLAAWQIDAYGDLGDKQKLSEAFTVFAAAVADIKAAYASVH